MRLLRYHLRLSEFLGDNSYYVSKNRTVESFTQLVIVNMMWFHMIGSFLLDPWYNQCRKIGLNPLITCIILCANFWKLVQIRIYINKVYFYVCLLLLLDKLLAKYGETQRSNKSKKNHEQHKEKHSPPD